MPRSDAQTDAQAPAVQKLSYEGWITMEEFEDMVEIGPAEYMYWALAEYLIAGGWMERYVPEEAE